MDEAEAESVLRALGQSLIWQPLTKTVEVAPTGGGDCYRVKTKHHGWLWNRQVTYDTEYQMVPDARFPILVKTQYGPSALTTLAAAKAACERHYTTDEWE